MDDPRFDLGDPASDVYEILTEGREPILTLGREMAELTVPYVLPPQNYKAGDRLPGNNQSIGGLCARTLASKLMFMAFPPGHPIMTLEPIETKMQDEIDADPDLYAKVLLALSRLEVSHRKRFLTTQLATTYEQYIMLLLIAGNGLWKHLKLDEPTYWTPEHYVVKRTPQGHPLVTILKQETAYVALDPDVQEMVREKTPERFRTEDDKERSDWSVTVDVYCVCKFHVDAKGEKSWLYWEEYDGEVIPDTEVETDYDDCPMWPGWLIPVYGSNWGQSYCEAFRGDLYTVEAAASGLNDGGALAAWALIFVKPSTRTSIRQVRKAKNLDMLTGSADDISVTKSEKGNDLSFLGGHLQQAARRLGSAFLLESATRREGERVTKEEVTRVGQELDRAMGGIYTSIAQGSQRRIIMRAMHLHEEVNKDLKLPKDVVEVGVVTGIDAMGNSQDAAELRELGMDINAVFGPGSAGKIMKPSAYASRLAAYKGIKPDGLVNKQEDMDAEAQKEKQEAVMAELAGKAAGPLAGAAGQSLMPPAQPPTSTPTE